MERGVSTYPVIKGFDVIKGIAPGLRSRLKGLAINAFAFEAMKEALHRCIIVTISSTTHADDHLFLLQECLIALTRVRACAERRKGADRKKKEEKRAKEERGEEEQHVPMLSRAACLSLRCNRCRMGDPGTLDSRSQERRDDPRRLSGERSSMAFCMCCAVAVPGGCCPMICPTGVRSTCISASGNGPASGNRSTPPCDETFASAWDGIPNRVRRFWTVNRSKRVPCVAMSGATTGGKKFKAGSGISWWTRKGCLLG